VAYSLSPSKSYALNATLSGRYLSAVTGDVVQLTATSPQFSQRYPGYAICRLTVTQRFLSRYTLSLTADNLLNYIPSYYDYNSPFTTGTTFTAAISASF
jgi:outer membrane receptor for ferrienterochelin and colicins